MAEMGLSYGIGIVEQEKLVPVRVRASSIDQLKGSDYQPLSTFPDANSEFTKNLVELFLEHEQEFGIVFNKARLGFSEHKLAKSTNPTDLARGVYWSGEVDECQVCGRDMSEVRFMLDSAIAPHGPWACMCAACFEEAGSRIGWGYGQLYERDKKGWRLVGGGRPDDNNEPL